VDVTTGVIDPDYTGELKAVLVNHGTTPFRLNPGDRIAQLILEKADTPLTKEVTSLEETTRGEQGLRHTGTTSIQTLMVGINIPPQEEWYRELRKVIPECYHDYLNVFDTDLCSSKLAPRRPGYDFEINLTPGAKLPPPA
jgi:hypothetical protein